MWLRCGRRWRYSQPIRLLRPLLCSLSRHVLAVNHGLDGQQTANNGQGIFFHIRDGASRLLLPCRFDDCSKRSMHPASHLTFRAICHDWSGRSLQLSFLVPFFLWSLVSWYSSISFDSVRLATCTSILDICRLAILRPYFCPLLPSSPRPYICIKRSSVYAFHRAISVLCLNRLATHAPPVLFAPKSFFLLFFLFSCRCCCRSPSDPVWALRMHFAAPVGQRGCVDIACQPAKYEVLALLQKSVKRTS